jgi:hypothetical protein
MKTGAEIRRVAAQIVSHEIAVDTFDWTADENVKPFSWPATR